MSLRFRARQIFHDAGASLLALPSVVASAIGLLGFVVAQAEFAAGVHLPMIELEPGTAQTLLATLAGSMMTVVSVVYSVLLVALSLASVQFSTRILSGLVRDRVSQAVLGLFLGTFLWQLVALRAVRSDPPFAPPITVACAVALVVMSLFALVLFIDRIIVSIQANHLVDRIASEAERVIDAVFPPAGSALEADPGPVAGAHTLRSRASGYIQLVSVEDACAIAARGLQIRLLRPVGAFVPEGAPLWSVSPPGACDRAVEDALIEAVDLGSIRTAQQDAEWGLRQIVDIGLKAISPAVNDPSTGATCIDQLSRLLIRIARRGPAPSVHRHGTGALIIPAPQFADLVDLAFDQLRQYGRADMAISLRLLRSIADVGEVATDPAARQRLRSHADQVAMAARKAFDGDDLSELERRYQLAQAALAAPTP